MTELCSGVLCYTVQEHCVSRCMSRCDLSRYAVSRYVSLCVTEWWALVPTIFGSVSGEVTGCADFTV